MKSIESNAVHSDASFTNYKSASSNVWISKAYNPLVFKNISEMWFHEKKKQTKYHLKRIVLSKSHLILPQLPQ